MKERPSPCYFCKKHRAYCRVGCKEWDDWHNEHVERCEAINKAKRIDGQLIGYRKDVHERIQKNKKYHGSKEKGAKS